MRLKTKNQIKNTDWQAWGRNLLKFLAPNLAVFFAQLALGVDPKAAALVALLGLWGTLADFLKKFDEAKT